METQEIELGIRLDLLTSFVNGYFGADSWIEPDTAILENSSIYLLILIILYFFVRQVFSPQALHFGKSPYRFFFAGKNIPSLFRYNPNDLLYVGAGMSVLSICVLAFFSYPFYNYSIRLHLFFLLGMLASRDQSKLVVLQTSGKIKYLKYIIAPALILGLLYFEMIQVRRIKAHIKWQKAVEYTRNDDFPRADSLYREIYPVLSHDPYFLYNYGSELSVHEQYKRSIRVLKKAAYKLNDADLYTYLGNSYEGLGRYKEAEQDYLQASYIIPYRFYPKYRLVLLYEKIGSHDKAYRLAHEIVNRKAKVTSAIVRQIKERMAEYIRESEREEKDSLP